jgi:hypothetical protein
MIREINSIMTRKTERMTRTLTLTFDYVQRRQRFRRFRLKYIKIISTLFSSLSKNSVLIQLKIISVCAIAFFNFRGWFLNEQNMTCEDFYNWNSFQRLTLIHSLTCSALYDIMTIDRVYMHFRSACFRHQIFKLKNISKIVIISKYKSKTTTAHSVESESQLILLRLFNLHSITRFFVFSV